MEGGIAPPQGRREVGGAEVREELVVGVLQTLLRGAVASGEALDGGLQAAVDEWKGRHAGLWLGGRGAPSAFVKGSAPSVSVDRRGRTISKKGSAAVLAYHSNQSACCSVAQVITASSRRWPTPCRRHIGVTNRSFSRRVLRPARKWSDPWWAQA